jgi:hypothetical protein
MDELDMEYKEGLITLKGYKRKKLNLELKIIEQ